jgi:hypothetical protein
VTAPSNPSYPSNPAPQGGGPVPPPIAPPVAPVRKRSKGRLIVSIVGLLVVVVLGIVGYVASQKDVVNAKVGSCIDPATSTSSTTTQDASGAKIVDCTSANAKFVVVGIVENKTKADFESKSTDPCAAFPKTTAALWWTTNKGSTASGSILCLEDKK